MARRSVVDRFGVPWLGRGAPVVSVVRLPGVIGGLGPLRRGMSLSGLARTLERAFGLRGVEAVALSINSPGGAPAQSALIHQRIRALADEKDVKVFAFAEDVAASGGYLLALAADEIYAEASSIVGSIGVVSSSFGFNEAIQRLGIERRLHTAGDKKAMLDPFRPEDPDDVAHLEAVQRDIHETFKRIVRDRRGSRLAQHDGEIFSGAFWTARRAHELGLVDGIGDLRSVMRARYGERVKLRPVGDERGWLWRRLGRRATQPPSPADWAEGVVGALEARVLWARYGL